MPDGSRPDYTEAVAVEPYELKPVDYTQGVFLVNEDWYGWDNGTVNFLTADGRLVYRAFRRENPGEKLGITTQYGSIYGDRFFLVSKQANASGDTSTGGRLVVADARSLKKIAAFDEIGGDGRAFLGVDEKTAYIGTSAGITLFDIESMQVGDKIEGTAGEGNSYAGQIGAMVRAGSYVFAAKQSVGVLVIDAATHTLHTTIELPTVSTLTLARDGGVWAADGSSLVRIDVATLETRIRALPEGCRVAGTWGAWNAGSLCAAYGENLLYFADESHRRIVRYDIDNDELNTGFFTLPDQDKKYVQQFQGAGLRVEPQSDRLFVITTESGYLSHYMNNWIHVVDGHSGELLDTVELERYYWFMAMPVFPDNEAPVIALPDRLSIGREPVKISLLEAVTDADNLSASIVSAVEVEDSSVATARISGYDLTVNGVNVGDTRLTFTVNSNGKKATRTVDVQVTEASGIDEAMCTAVEAWPNPVHDRLTIVAVDGSVFGLVDLRGIPVCRGVVSGGKAAVNLSAIAPGIYVLTVQNGGSVKNMRIVKR